MDQSVGLEAQQKNWFAKHPRAKIAIIVGAAGAFCLAFCAFLLFFIFGLMRNSDPVKLALARVRANPSVIEQIGQPIQAGWFVTGSMNTSGPSGHAELSIPITGPKGKGTIYLIADKKLGQWSFSALQVAPQDESVRIDLLETAPVPSTATPSP